MAHTPHPHPALRRGPSLAGCAALLLLLSACAVEPAGRDDATYYYANREPAPRVPTVQPLPLPVPAATEPGPAGVARIVYFDFDRAVVRQADKDVLAAHARFLRQHPGQKLTLEGHTDPRGGRAYNLALGQRRADAVQQALVLLGANGADIEAVSWGMEKPVSTDQTDAGFQRDRRAEFSYR
jgi:peptidoglycan-associated lipoprotein